MNRREILEAALLVLLLLAMVFGMVYSFSRHLRNECQPVEPEPELAGCDLKVREQETIRIEETSVDTFIEDVPVRSSTGPSEPHSDPEDRDLVERIVMAEAGVEPYPGVVAVAQVILDQCREWGISIRETCTVPGRFTDPYQGDVSDRVKTAVHEVFDLGIRVTDEPITHFHNPTVDPYWAHTLTFVVRIGDHLFYR